MSGVAAPPAGLIARLGRLGGLLGEAAMAFMAMSIVYDVVMRYIFLAPTIWALEVNTFLLVFLCVVPAADVLTAGTQIQITFLTDRLSRGAQEKLSVVGNAAGVLFSAVMTWKGLTMSWAAWQHNDRMSTSLGTPIFIPYLFLFVGFGLLGLTFGGRLLATCWRKPATPASERQVPDVGQQI